MERQYSTPTSQKGILHPSRKDVAERTEKFGYDESWRAYYIIGFIVKNDLNDNLIKNTDGQGTVTE